MTTCKTCVWWQNGACDFLNTVLCERVNKDEPNKRMELFAEASDDTGLRAELRTGPDFGCIHHLQRNKERKNDS